MSRQNRTLYMGMKYLKIFEDYKEIKSICEEYCLVNYTINNGLVDVDSNVDLSGMELTRLPVKFGKVTGDFKCYNNKLTTLEGCPTYIGGSLVCYINKLTTLEGCTPYIGDSAYFTHNKLTILEGYPKHIGGSFWCEGNPVYEIYKLFPSYVSFIDSLDYDYFRDDNKINKIRLTQALLELDLECPENIRGYIWE